MTTMMAHYDAIVVGLGGVGSFALRALSKEATGGRFLGLEVGSLSTTTACATAGHSSRGLSRIYRRAYFEHASYVPWIDHSLKVFLDLQVSSGESLMRECGTLLLEPAIDSASISPETTPASLPPLLASSWNSAQLHDVTVEYLSTMQLKERFPQFTHKRHNTSNNTSMVGLLEPGGGFLRPERIMKLALREASEEGSGCVTILDETCITKMVQNVNGSGRIELHLQHHNKDGTSLIANSVVTTDKLLVSMGARTTDLIPSWSRILHPVRQIQGWIDTSCRQQSATSTTGNLYSCRNMPSFCVFVARLAGVALWCAVRR